MKFTTCQWIGQGEGCNHDSLTDSSYCHHHYPRIYAVGSALSRRRADQRLAGYIVRSERDPSTTDPDTDHLPEVSA
jgi:hypothetical protein